MFHVSPGFTSMVRMMTDFKGAQVRDTRFCGAYLHGADLSQAVDLTPAQVDDIYSDETTRVPGHFPPHL